jgi:hypothetical protein
LQGSVLTPAEQEHRNFSDLKPPRPLPERANAARRQLLLAPRNAAVTGWKIRRRICFA